MKMGAHVRGSMETVVCVCGCELERASVEFRNT